MTVGEAGQALECRVVQGEFDDRAVRNAYTSDLLSDVMAHATDADILVTIQSHKNTVAVAVLVGAAAIVICNARPVPDDMIAAARAERIGLLVTDADQFTVSGRLYGMIHG